MRPFLDPFTLTAPLEILQWLRQMVQQQPLMRLYNPTTQESFLTTLLDLDESNNQLFLDASQDEGTNHRLIETNTATLSTQLHRIPFEFRVSQLQLAYHRGQAFLSCPVPTTMRRIQRRESFRVTPPKIPPALCRISTSALRLELLIENISTTGIALSSLEARLDVEPPYFLSKNILELPNFGTLIVDMTVVRTQLFTLNQKETYLLGCRFENLTPQQERELQDYIFMLQRIQAAKDKGLY